MANITITNCDLGSVQAGPCEFRDETINFAAADTFAEGTILAKRHVTTAITPSAVTGTGNGTVTAASVIGGTEVPKAGNWTLRCKAAATHGGTFALEDPDGRTVATLILTAGAGVASAFEAAGMAFTINDGSTDFAVGDTFTLPVVADGDLVPFATTGVGGAQYPYAVLPYALTKASSGDLPCRVIVGGLVNKDRLIIDADGDGSNLTTAHLDMLRAVGIQSVKTTQLSVLDNQ